MSGSIVVSCLLAFLIGIVAGMRAMTAPAAPNADDLGLEAARTLRIE